MSGEILALNAVDTSYETTFCKISYKILKQECSNILDMGFNIFYLTAHKQDKNMAQAKQTEYIYISFSNHYK